MSIAAGMSRSHEQGFVISALTSAGCGVPIYEVVGCDGLDGSTDASTQPPITFPVIVAEGVIVEGTAPALHREKSERTPGQVYA
jgi:hypothetical protein